MNYIVNTPYGSKSVSKDKIIEFNKPSFSVVKDMLIDNLSSYEAYIKAVKIKLGLKSLIPIYISDSIILIPTMRVRDYDNIWINYLKINKINISNIIFIDNTSLAINNKFKKSITKVKVIIDYMNNKNGNY